MRLNLQMKYRYLAIGLSCSIAFIVVIVVAIVVYFDNRWRVQNVTNDMRFGDFSLITGVWHTTVPAILYKGDFEGDETMAIIFGDWHDAGWEVLAVIPPGTAIKIESLKYQESLGTTFLWITGRIINGEHAQKEVKVSDSIVPREVLDSYQMYFMNSTIAKPPWRVDPEKLVR